jgi:hypothetical protein
MWVARGALVVTGVIGAPKIHRAGESSAKTSTQVRFSPVCIYKYLDKPNPNGVALLGA